MVKEEIKYFREIEMLEWVYYIKLKPLLLTMFHLRVH